jgi:hypothetical protein
VAKSKSYGHNQEGKRRKKNKQALQRTAMLSAADNSFDCEISGNAARLCCILSLIVGRNLTFYAFDRSCSSGFIRAHRSVSALLAPQISFQFGQRAPMSIRS